MASPLTHTQLLMWTGQKLAGRRPAYNMAFSFGLEGALDRERFATSFEELVRRVDVLRTVIDEVDGEPRQRLLDRPPRELEQVDLSGRSDSEADPTARLDEWLRARSRERLPLDIRHYDAALVRLRPDRHAWYLNLHHLITDGQGYALVYRLMSDLYAGKEAEPIVPFAEWARSDRERKSGARHDRAIEHWRTKEAESVDPASFYGATAASAGERETRVGLELGEQRTRALFELAGQPELRALSESFTLQSLLSAVLLAFMHRVSGNRRLAHAIPFHHRDSPEARGTAGLVQEMLPVFATVERDETFLSLARKVMRESWSGMRHARYASAGATYQRASEVLLNYPDISFPPFAGLRTRVRRIHPGWGDGKRMLFVQAHDFEGRGRLTIDFDFNDGVFDRRRRERTERDFLRVLDTCLEAPATSVDRVALMNADERRATVSGLNQTGRDLPESTISRMFERRARIDCKRTALEFDGGSSTYSELNAEANRLARYLRDRGVAPGTLVAMHAERGREMIVGLLAIFKAGGAYVPLDPSYPRERLAFVLADTESPVLLTQRRLLGELPDTGVTTLCLDELETLLTDEPAGDLDVETTLDHPAYLIYTSGSTGKPKGVVMSQRVLVNLIHWQMREATALERPRTLQFTPLAFDVSLQETFATWCSGGTLILMSEDLRRDSEATLRFVKEARVEQLYIIFTPLQQLAEAVVRTGLVPETLREVITAGEQVQITAELSSLFSKLTDCRFQNQYGPSETHIVTLYRLAERVESWPRLPPIGRPIANTTMYVLDDNFEPRPQGVPGELLIGGYQVADGYLGRPRLTAEKFVPDPFGKAGARLYRSGDLARYRRDGEIEFLGRIDHQVKIRGYRVELGEVEAELGQHPAVGKAAVIVREDQPGDKRLVGYIEPAPETAESEDGEQHLARELRRQLQESLPPYMVPSAIVVLDQLPRTPNGKLNRRALPAPAAVRPDLEATYVAPSGALESRIADVWREELDIERVGTRDNFFDLGGHSLVLVQVHQRMRNELGLDLEVTDLFRLPTISAVVDHLARRPSEPSLAERIRQRAERQRAALSRTPRGED